MVTDQQEQEVFDEFLHEAEEDAKKPDRKGTREGIIGIVVGVIGFFMPFGVQMLFGAFGAGLAVYANHHGERRLAIPAAILAIINFLGLIFGIKF